MSSKAYVIDFGTSNSGIGAISSTGQFNVVKAQRPLNPLGDEATFTEPSWIYIDDKGQKLSGWNALYTYQKFMNSGSIGDQAHLVSGLKSDLGSVTMHDGVFFRRWGLNLQIEDMIAIVLAHLRTNAEKEFGDAPGSVKRLLLACPVVFVGARVDPGEKVSKSHHEGLNRLRLAAEKAGFKDIEFYDEASASARAVQIPEGKILSVDFGGGTLDIAACQKYLNKPSEVLAVRGLGFGGDDIDRELFEHLFYQRLGLDPSDNQISSLPNRHRRIRNLREYLNVLRDPDAVPNANTSAQIDGNESLFAYVLHMQNHRGIELYRNLMAAKSKLEHGDNVEFPYRLTSDIDWKTQINEDHVNTAFQIYESRVKDTILGVLQDAGWRFTDVEHIVLSGGSSRLMTFRKYLSALFPDSQVSMGDSFTNVLEGLGVRAQEIWP
jgi:hypothetical chaperone protein